MLFEIILWALIGALPGFYTFFMRGYDTRLGIVLGVIVGVLVGVVGQSIGIIASSISAVVIIIGLVGVALLLLPPGQYDQAPSLERRLLTILGGLLIVLFLLVGVSEIVFFGRSIDPGIVTIFILVAYIFLIPRGNFAEHKSKNQRITDLAYALTIPTVLIVMGIVIFPVVWNVVLSLRPIRVADLPNISLVTLDDITADGRVWYENFYSQGGLRLDTVPCEYTEDGSQCARDDEGNIIYVSPRRTLDDYRGWREWFPLPSGGEQQTVVGVRDPEFYPMIARTLAYTLASTVSAIFFGLVAALIVREAFPGRAFFRGFLLFPYIAPVISVAFIWKILLRSDGLINSAMGTRINFLGDNSLLPLLMVILFQTWRYFPFAFLFLLARIQAIPDEMYEAAKVDGATPINRLIYITLPQLRAVFGTLFLLRFIWTFNKFDDVFLLTGAISQTKVIPVQIFELLFTRSNVGQASAVAVIMAGILAIVLLIYFRYFLVEEN
ncbi:MAG: carbohydrate ABC transporter permease [Anaerolineae bacterium]